MIDRWIEHLYNLYGGYGYYYLQSGVPNDVAYGLHIAVIGSFAVWAFYDRNNFIKKAIILLLADYILFLFCSTILFRTECAETGWKLIPFWKYREIVNGYDQQYESTHSGSRFNLYLKNLKRLGKEYSLCPSEVLWAPIWKPSHWLWRNWKGCL